VTTTPVVGDRVLVHLAEHCGEPGAEEVGVVDYVFPGGRAFTVRFDDLCAEVVALYEVKAVLAPLPPFA